MNDSQIIVELIKSRIVFRFKLFKRMFGGTLWLNYCVLVEMKPNQRHKRKIEICIVNANNYQQQQQQSLNANNYQQRPKINMLAPFIRKWRRNEPQNCQGNALNRWTYISKWSNIVTITKRDKETNE